MLVIADIADIFIFKYRQYRHWKNSRYADIEKKCRYADIADADINIGTALIFFIEFFVSRLDNKPISPCIMLLSA